MNKGYVRFGNRKLGTAEDGSQVTNKLVEELASMVKTEIRKIFDQCYSKDLSVCPKHTIFQREKASGLIVKLILSRSDLAEALEERE